MDRTRLSRPKSTPFATRTMCSGRSIQMPSRQTWIGALSSCRATTPCHGHRVDQVHDDQRHRDGDAVANVGEHRHLTCAGQRMHHPASRRGRIRLAVLRHVEHSLLPCRTRCLIHELPSGARRSDRASGGGSKSAAATVSAVLDVYLRTCLSVNGELLGQRTIATPRNTAKTATACASRTPAATCRRGIRNKLPLRWRTRPIYLGTPGSELITRRS